jgi:hypothetical protein
MCFCDVRRRQDDAGRALARSGGEFTAIQCTPDLLPSKLLGTTIDPWTYETSCQAIFAGIINWSQAEPYDTHAVVVSRTDG